VKLTLCATRGYDPGVPPSGLALSTQRLVVVTGKGGVGKTTVTAALARAAADAGRRTLAVEVGRGSLAALLGGGPLGAEPTRIATGLSAATVEAEAVLGDFLHSVLRIRALSRRLLESTSFQVLAAAAPGLPELLVLQRLLGWVEARRLGRAVYDLVVVDAPASGHSLPLLAAPRTLGALVRFGPVGTLLGRLERLLADPASTLVCVVTTPEELAVRETVELHEALRGHLGLPVAPPIVNAVPARRFPSGDTAALERLDASHGDHPHVLAARFHVQRHARAETQIAALRQALGVRPIRLPFLFAAPDAPASVAALVAELAQAAGLAA
jgi:anion-transporting  ArsA/GET3 family ATPase